MRRANEPDLAAASHEVCRDDRRSVGGDAQTVAQRRRDEDSDMRFDAPDFKPACACPSCPKPSTAGRA
jgi:hypothetical protein